MECQKCGSERLLSVDAKCSDACYTTYGDIEKDGYVPSDIGIGGGDYVEITVCMRCGQLQGEWPKDDETIRDSIIGE
jgi:hypothetical protein